MNCQHQPSGVEDIVGVICGCGKAHSRKEQCAVCGEWVLWHDFPGRGPALRVDIRDDFAVRIDTRRAIVMGAAAHRLKFADLYNFTGYGPFVATDEQLAAMREKWEKR